MSNLAIPFNVSLLVLDDSMLRGLRPVKTNDVFVGMTKNFHEDGLFSQAIFGRVGDEARSRRFSYIDIKVPIFHPVIYETLCKIKRIYGEIIQGKTYAVFDKSIGDFVKSNQLDGQTGYHFFVSNWNNIKYPDRKSDSRELNIQLINKFKNKCFLDKIVVMPAGLRDYEITADGRESEDEINTLYRKILSISNSISMQVFNYSPALLDSARNALQQNFNALYELLKSSVEGKKKLYMGKWATRAVFNGTRNVITTSNIPVNELGSPGNPGFNDTVVGLYQYMKATLPVTKYQIKNSFLSTVFTGPNVPAKLVDKKTLKAVHHAAKPKNYDLWMSDEGLDKIISMFGEESIRHKALEVEGYYMGLIYKDKGYFKVFSDIDELPGSFDKSKVTPLTFTELLYLSVYPHYKRYPAFITRYPVTGFGSIYPSKLHLKTTVKTETLKPLNELWEPDDSLPIAWQFPTKTSFFNSVSPAPSHLKTLGADFDGDTCSLIIAYSEESIEEVNMKLNSRSFYVNTSGKISFSLSTDTVDHLVQNLTGEPVGEID